MKKRATWIIISSVILVTAATCMPIVFSFVTAKGVMNRLHASGYLDGEHYVGAILSIYSSPHTDKVQPCWVFKFEDIETDSNHYVSLTGKYLGSRGYGRQVETEIKRWVSVGNHRRGYFDEEKYKTIALGYLINSPPDNADLTKFDCENLIPMIPDGSFVPRRFRNIVTLNFDMKRQYWGAETNGYFPTEGLKVLMTKDGRVIKVERQRFWVEEIVTNKTIEPNKASEPTSLRSEVQR